MSNAKTEFDAAVKALKQADAKAVAAGRRADELAAQLLQAKLDSSRLDTEVQRFAIGDDSGEEIRKKAGGLARELVGKRAECETVIALLDRALTAAQDLQRHAKVEAVRIEARVLELQKQCAKEMGAELVREFFTENRTRLLRLLQVVHIECVLQRYKKYGHPDGYYGIRSLEDLFSNILAEAAAEIEKTDTAYENVLGTTTKADVPNTPVLASAITSPERGRLAELAYRADTDAALLEAVSQDDTPPAAQPMSNDDRGRIIQNVRDHEYSADRHKRTLENNKRRLAEIGKADAHSVEAHEARRLIDENKDSERQLANAEAAIANGRAALEADQALR